MKLVIDIPEGDYKFIKDLQSLIIGGRGSCKTIQMNVINAIRNGTPYEPKGDLTEAEKKICKIYLEDLDKTHTCNEYKLLMNLINNAPTVEPRIEYGTDGQPYKLSMTNGKEYERPKGKWIKEPNGKSTDIYRCSVCKRSIMLCKGADLTNYPFCHCGADMRGKEK